MCFQADPRLLDETERLNEVDHTIRRNEDSLTKDRTCIMSSPERADQRQHRGGENRNTSSDTDHLTVASLHLKNRLPDSLKISRHSPEKKQNELSSMIDTLCQDDTLPIKRPPPRKKQPHASVNNSDYTPCEQTRTREVNPEVDILEETFIEKSTESRPPPRRRNGLHTQVSQFSPTRKGRLKSLEVEADTSILDGIW